jgi:hypothetical protein
MAEHHSPEGEITVTATTPFPKQILMATELDRRSGAGAEIRLLWVRDADELLVEQRELFTGEITLRRAERAQALEVFHHPETFPAVELDYEYEVDRGEIELAKVA